MDNEELVWLNELRVKVKELHEYLYDCNKDFATVKLLEMKKEFIDNG